MYDVIFQMQKEDSSLLHSILISVTETEEHCVNNMKNIEERFLFLI